MGENLSQSQSSQAVQDERSGLRKRSLLSGKLVSEAGDVSFDCVIRDLSETGARVKLPVGFVIPDSLWLIHVVGGVAYRVEVRWRNDRELGLSFLEAHDMNAPTPARLVRLRLLWLECSPRQGVVD